MISMAEQEKLQGNNQGRVSSCTESLQTGLGLPASHSQNEPDFFAVNCLMWLMRNLKAEGDEDYFEFDHFCLVSLLIWESW